MAPSILARLHQRQREDLADTVARSVLAEWSKVNPDAVARDWARLLPRVTAMVQAGQLHAASGTHTFMKNLLGADADGAPEIVPEQFASQTPDGRDLKGLLAQSVPTALDSRRRGFSARAAMAHGAAFLNMVTRTVVADTGRQADRVAMYANRKVTSYIRVVEMPACSRCIILAGREYSMSTGFQRHPNCDCTMEPVTKKHKPTITDAEDLYDAMSESQRKKVFGEAGAKAIADGARISTVVNARKGMDHVMMHGQRVQVTHTGTGSKRKPRRPPRLMPEEIYRIADGREEAIRLLYKNGYLR